jgi:transcriptional regulator with XRE-family HTH domain
MDERKKMRIRDKNIFQLALGRVIRKKRTFRGDTMEKLAWDIGIDPKHLNDIELGHTEVGSYILALLQIELNFSSDEYLQEFKQMKAERTEKD